MKTKSNRLHMRLMLPCIFIVMVILLFSDSSAFVPSKNIWQINEHKYDLTAPVLRKMGWLNEDAIYKVNRANEYTDIYDQARSHRGVYCTVYPSVCIDSYILETIVNSAAFNCYPSPIDAGPVQECTRGFHFDNLFTYQLIENRWDSLNSWINNLAELIKKNHNFNIEYWLTLIGIVLHAVQDFYCHSNWIILTNYYGYPQTRISGDLLPIREELNDSTWQKKHRGFNKKTVIEHFKISNQWTADREFNRIRGKVTVYGGLQTGRWLDNFWILNGQRVFPWGHRHPGDAGMTRRRDELNRDAFGYFEVCDDEKQAALELSFRASEWWVEYLTSIEMLGEYRETFLNHVKKSSTPLYKFAMSLRRSNEEEKKESPKVKAILDTLNFEKPSEDAINK